MPKTPPPDREQVKELKSRAHALNPVVIVGKDGLTDAVVKAIDAALTTHELIKVKLLKSVEVEKTEAASELADRCDAHLIQRIGRTAVLYRENPEDDE